MLLITAPGISVSLLQLWQRPFRRHKVRLLFSLGSFLRSSHPFGLNWNLILMECSFKARKPQTGVLKAQVICHPSPVNVIIKHKDTEEAALMDWIKLRRQQAQQRKGIISKWVSLYLSSKTGKCFTSDLLTDVWSVKGTGNKNTTLVLAGCLQDKLREQITCVPTSHTTVIHIIVEKQLSHGPAVCTGTFVELWPTLCSIFGTADQSCPLLKGTNCTVAGEMLAWTYSYQVC